jgi:5'-nucleotidase
MHILLANDDGYLAPGLAVLHAALALGARDRDRTRTEP